MANLSDYRSFITTTRYNSQDTLCRASVWQHQHAMLEFALSMDKCLIYAGMGSGKTLVGLRYHEHFSGLRLVLCPRRAMPVWKADYDAFYPDQKPYELHLIDETIGSSKAKTDYIQALFKRKAQAVIVINYESAALIPLHHWNFSAAVADEAHRLASYKGKQSRILAKTCKDILFKVAMTGTPHTDGYERLYGITRWLDPIIPANPRAYPMSKVFGTYDSFLDRFCKTWLKGYIKIIQGYRNLGTLADLIRPFTLLIKTEDVIDLPEAVYRRYEIELSPETLAAYKSLKDDAIIEFDGDAVLAPHVLARITRLQQLVSSGELASETGELKQFDIDSRLEMLRNILEELEDVPVVISCKFVHDVALVSQVVRDMFGIEPHYLTGDLDNHKEWYQGDGRILIATVSAGSEGVRLERAHHIIRYSRGWSLKNDSQGEARVRRFGQKSKTTYCHDIVAKDTIDEAIYMALRRKAGDVNALDRELM